MEKAGIRFPKLIKSPKDIDRLVIVKVNEAIRGYERAFFYATNYKDYLEKSNDLLKKKMITKEALDQAVIEEYIIGAQVNFNYFYSAVDDELEIMGTDTRRQTNLDGLIRLPANEQLEVLKYMRPKIIETGHIAATTKESIIEKIFTLGEKFVATTKKECPPGIIGPLASLIFKPGMSDDTSSNEFPWKSNTFCPCISIVDGFDKMVTFSIAQRSGAYSLLKAG